MLYVIAVVAAIAVYRFGGFDRLPVPIVAAADSHFPKQWTDPPSSLKWTTPEETDTVAAERILRPELNSYPRTLLATHLHAVIICGSLQFSGILAGGTSSHSSVFIALTINGSPQSPQSLKSALHHELSSVLLRHRPDLLSLTAWEGTNTSGFQYGGGFKAAAEQGFSSTTFSPRWAAEGFVCEYAMASPEEDFNMVVQCLFTNPSGFWSAVSTSKVLRRKVDLAVTFYQGLHPKFTREWFQERR